MSVCHIHGLTSTNPFTRWGAVSLDHPDSAHTLCLTAFAGSEGYQSTLLGWQSSDGRSLTGGLRIQGAGYRPPEEWQISAIVSTLQADLFQALLSAQATTATPITLSDTIGRLVHTPPTMDAPTWLPGSPTLNAMGMEVGHAAWATWIDVDTRYLTRAGRDRWLLQFTARQD